MHLRKKCLIVIFTAAISAPFGAFSPMPQKQQWRIGGTSLYAADKAAQKEISELIEALLDEKDEAKRREIIKKLRSYPPEETGSQWLDLLKGAVLVGTTVRILDGMAEFNDRRFVMPLSARLISSHYPVRRSAARALKKIGDDRLYPVILNMVSSPNPVHRIYFIEAMNFLYDNRFYPSLAGLMNEENKSIRIYVITCFKENRIVESYGMIRNAAMNDKNEEVRIAAIEAIGALRDAAGLNVLHATLGDKSRDIRRESAKSISLIGSQMSVIQLCYRLAAEDDNEIKEIMIETLAGMKRVADVRGLEKIMLTDPSVGLRIKAAYVLGFSGTQQAFASLSQALKDSDFRVRAEACNSLGNFRTRQALTVLFEILDREEQGYVKSSALYSIKRINDKSSLMGFFDLYVKEKDPVFRELLREAIREYIKRFI